MTFLVLCISWLGIAQWAIGILRSYTEWLKYNLQIGNLRGNSWLVSLTNLVVVINVNVSRQFVCWSHTVQNTPNDLLYSLIWDTYLTKHAYSALHSPLRSSCFSRFWSAEQSTITRISVTCIKRSWIKTCHDMRNETTTGRLFRHYMARRQPGTCLLYCLPTPGDW